jgi:hypothetical protein
MVGATAIDLTAFVRSCIVNLFVRFVVKHPVSRPHAIGPYHFAGSGSPGWSWASELKYAPEILESPRYNILNNMRYGVFPDCADCRVDML